VPIEIYAANDMKGNQINNLGDPSIDPDAANKRYVDAEIRKLDWKQSARVSAPSNVNLAAPGANIDGVALSTGDRFLARAQSTGSQNGLYVWNGAAVPATRAVDADTSAEVTAGAMVVVSEGTAPDTVWMLTTNDPIILGTTALVFAKVSGQPISFLVGDGVSQTYVLTHNLGTRDVTVTTYRDSGAFVEVYPEVQHTDVNSVTLRFTPAPAVNEFRVVVR
jgi:hypothetical protein